MKGKKKNKLHIYSKNNPKTKIKNNIKKSNYQKRNKR
jgi:hypothetical protein